MVETLVKPKKKKEVAVIASPPLAVAAPSATIVPKKATKKPSKKVALIETASPALDMTASVSTEMKAAWVAEAAYFRAERRNFAPGFEMEDWYEAEREVEELLRR